MSFYDELLNRMRAAIEAGDYIVTKHARQEMLADDFDVFDLENAILTGEIITPQDDAGETKYVLAGEAVNGRELETVVKFLEDGGIAFITVYAL